jgi:hypothetical protein
LFCFHFYLFIFFFNLKVKSDTNSATIDYATYELIKTPLNKNSKYQSTPINTNANTINTSNSNLGVLSNLIFNTSITPMSINNTTTTNNNNNNNSGSFNNNLKV